jgi:glycosyltransferase involved in cell wall biosynthesis
VSKKNLLIIAQRVSPRIGGVETHIKETSKYLKNKFNLKIISQKNIEYKSIKYLGLLQIWFYFLRNIKLFFWADVIHIHDVFIWILPFRFLFFNKKFVLTHHGWEGKFPIPKKNIIYKKIFNKLANKTISVGEYINKFYKIKTDKIIYGGVNIPKSFVKKENLIIFLGRLDRDTGLLDFLEYCKKLKKYKIIFVGDGQLINKCKKFGQVTGFVNPDKYLEKAKIVFAGGYLSALEAMANKCLVITSFDNDLKKSYWLDSPFKSFINKKDSNIIKEAFEFAQKQSWDKIAKLYEKYY